jgi:hypothetical protein
MTYTNTLADYTSLNNSIQHHYFGGVMDSGQRMTLSENNLNQIKTIKSFSLLKENWDSYNAEKPSPEAIIKAISFSLWLSQRDIEIFFTAPIADGDILVELKNENANIEFVFSSNTEDKILAWCDGDLRAEEELNDTTRNAYLKWLICPDGNCPDL